MTTAVAEVPTMEGARLHVTFHLHDLTFYLHIGRVREVLKVQEVTPVPLASSLIAGLINLRGEIVPAIDRRPLLGARGGIRESDMVVVVHANEGAFSLVVDHVHDIVEIDPTTVHEAPANLPGYLEPLTNGACKLPGSLLLSLDVQGVTQIVEAHRQA